MRHAPVFRQIYQENILPVQEFISVDYDNRLQTPVSFSYLGRKYEVIELIGAFQDGPTLSATTFLVRTPYGVCAIYPDARNTPLAAPAHWVLHYFVEEDPADNEVNMLVDLRLKQIADFHGHLCPDLIIGYRAAQYALSRLEIRLAAPGSLRVIVENSTSAVDAIQMLTGCTPGNLRLAIRDEGKHIYTFLADAQHGLCLALAPAGQEMPPEMLALESKIQAGRSSLEETALYQHLLDQRILQLLRLPPEALFNARWVEVAWPEQPLSSAIQVCDGCGEPVIGSHIVVAAGRRLCQRCVAARKAI